MTNLENVIKNRKIGCYTEKGYLIELLKVALRENVADIKSCLSESELAEFKAFLRVARCADVHLLIVGGSPRRLEMKQQIAALSDELEQI